jgi:hypothetical protein
VTVDTLPLKLVLTPTLIATASLAGRRWGPSVGGWFVGLPLTSGPIAFFLALERGTGFAALVAVGALAGAFAEVAFCLAYTMLARRHGWIAASLASCVAFGVAAALLQRWSLPFVALSVAVFVTLAVAVALMPRRATMPSAPTPRWDLPARMIVATALVLAITGAATTLGPRLSGVLGTFPVYAAILTIFAHRTSPAAAVQVLRGLLIGLFAFAAFFVVLALSIERIGVSASFVAATIVALAVQGGSLALVVRERARGGYARPNAEGTRLS